MNPLDTLAVSILSEAVVTQAGECGLGPHALTVLEADTMQVGSYTMVITNRDRVTLLTLAHDGPGTPVTARFVNAPGTMIVHAAVALLVEAYAAGK